jgi:hypothetical protein
MLRSLGMDLDEPVEIFKRYQIEGRKKEMKREKIFL